MSGEAIILQTHLAVCVVYDNYFGCDVHDAYPCGSAVVMDPFSITSSLFCNNININIYIPSSVSWAVCEPACDYRLLAIFIAFALQQCDARVASGLVDVRLRLPTYLLRLHAVVLQSECPENL